MDFIEIVSQAATPFSHKKLVYLHCLDRLAQETVQLDDFPCIEVKLLLGHISFPRKIAERRMCAFVNRHIFMNLLKDRRSPVLIEVINSCDIKSNGRTLTVIVEFRVVPNSYPVKAKPKELEEYDDEEDPLPTTPLLDIEKCNCNCTNYRNNGFVLVNANDTTTSEGPYDTDSDTSESEGSVKEDFVGDELEKCTDDNDDDEPEKFTEYFELKGSSYHEDCQKALRKCKEMQLKKQSIDLHVNPEPTNIRDKNAIIVEAKLDDEWSRIGYIQKEKVRKVTKAMKNNEIDKVDFKSIGFQYIPDINDWLYQPRVLITKSHHWLPTDASYKYNDNLD